MNSPHKNISGMTIVEMTIYIAIVSILLSSVIGFLYEVHFGNMKLNDDIIQVYETNNSQQL